MKRKGPRNIPDFSAKKSPTVPIGAPKSKVTAPPPVPIAKPRATSAKSGQRGR